MTYVSDLQAPNPSNWFILCMYRQQLNHILCVSIVNNMAPYQWVLIDDLSGLLDDLSQPIQLIHIVYCMYHNQHVITSMDDLLEDLSHPFENL